MTTETATKAPTKEEVERWWSDVVAGIDCTDPAVCAKAGSATLRLKSAALLGAQVPGLVADNAALVERLTEFAAAVEDADFADSEETRASLRGQQVAADIVLVGPHSGAVLLVEHQRVVAALQVDLKGAQDALVAAHLREVDLERQRDDLQAHVLEVEAKLSARSARVTALERDVQEQGEKADALQAREALDSARARLWAVIRQTAFICSSEGAGRCLRPVPGMDPGECADCGRKAGGLDWLLLTKRPEHWELVPEDVRPLVWLGTSISDQTTADEWVPRLLKAEGFRYRFVSLEPMVGPVDLRKFMWPVCGWWRGPYRNYDEAKAAGAECGLKRQALVSAHSRFVDWVIVGGESGPKARPCNVAWVRDVVRQCREHHVPVFVKQLGPKPYERVSQLGGGHAGKDLMQEMERAVREPPPPGWTTVVTAGERFLQRHLKLNDPKGGDMTEWPEDLRVREVPRG